MFKSAVFALGLISASVASAHHAECSFGPEGFMSCGAHSGRVSFLLQNYGAVRTDTEQLVICGDRPVDIERLEFKWVESSDEASHFPMKDLKVKQISPECTMLGGLDFTPPADFKSADQNAWKLEIFVKGVDLPSSVFVEAQTAN